MRLYSKALWYAVVILFGATVFQNAGRADEFADFIKEAFDSACSSDSPASVIFQEGPEGASGHACGRSRLHGAPAQVDDRFLIASVSKLYLAVALLQQQDEGVLDVDDPAEDWLSREIVDSLGGLDGITIAHLLTMTSGLPDYLDDDYHLEIVEAVERGISDGEILVNAILSIKGKPRLFDPGTEFNYSNTNYLLAQLVLEKATGRPMHEVFAERLFKPADLERTQLLGYGVGPGDFVQGYEDFGNGLEPVDDYLSIYGFGDGGLVSSAAEVAKFYRVLFAERRLLSEESLARLLSDAVNEGYGMGVEMETLPGKGVVLGHSGADTGFSADVRYLPELEIAVVFLSAEADDEREVSWELLEVLP